MGRKTRTRQLNAIRHSCWRQIRSRPDASANVIPYVAAELEDTNFVVSNVTTVAAGRTFWDKIIILHGLRRWFDCRGIVRQEGQRVTRHYYDVYRLLASQIGQDALANRALGLDCARHARMFFNRPDLDLDAAVAGDFSLTPAARYKGDRRHAKTTSVTNPDHSSPSK
ncbi:nucleotidyl transferase AbiEii/AbiGii toxin family protein [Mesorhizobium sp. PL10]